jgi:hypothetical protein
MAAPLELIIDASGPIENLETIADEIEVALYAGDVLNVKSGALLGSVMEEGPNATGGEIVATVTAGGDEAPYGIIHERGGQSEYDIYPVNRQALMFELNGKTVFAHSVHHPPLPQRPWFDPVVVEMMALWQDELQEAIGEVLAQ